MDTNNISDIDVTYEDLFKGGSKYGCIKNDKNEIVWPEESDLSVWREVDPYITYDKVWKYHIDIEGNIGYKTLHDGIEYYKQMFYELKAYMNREHIDLRMNKYDADTIYHTRDVKVSDDKDNKCWWIHTKSPTFYELKECYFWMEDVVHQLEELEKRLAKSKNK